MTNKAARPEASADTMELAEDLRSVVGRFVRVVRAHAETPTSAQSETLGLLERDSMSIAALALRRSVKHQSMRLVIAQLERDGLIARTADPGDRRSQSIALTDRGRAVLDDSRQARVTWIATALLDHLTADERQNLRGVVTALERLVDASTP